MWEAVTTEGNRDVNKGMRAALVLTGCAAGLALAAPAALADTTDEPEVAAESPIQADEGTVLAETSRPERSAAGEQTCSRPDVFNPLTAFKDRRDYFVAPAGDFEDPSLPGWELTGGAHVAAGGSSHAVMGDAQTGSLLLPPGSSATSPQMCVDLDYPTFRFFAAQLQDDTDSELAVDVIYPGLAKNNVRQAKTFRLKARDGWRLSDSVNLEPQRLGKHWGWRRIAIRFRVVQGKKSAAAYRVDDLLVDPRRFN
jgi:hypothetical protein